MRHLLACAPILVVLATGASAGGIPPLTSTATMSVERAAHTATRLADGRVLVAGGIRMGEAALRSAEVYDPDTGTFTPTGDMRSVRSGHTATLLRDGRVLIAGGFDDEQPLATAEIYDPSSGSFAPAGLLAARRGGPTATRLPDGRVLVVGGYDGDRSLRTAELYDPSTGRFAPTGRMQTRRASHTATLLASGRVLVTGGDTPDRVLRTAEIFDRRSGRFSSAGPLNVRRHKHAAVRLGDGRVLVVGGSDERDWEGRYRSTELFDPRTGRFTRAGALGNVRFKFADAVAVSAAGSVLLAGGAAILERYRGGRFLPVARLDAARYFSTATLLRDGTILIVGGYDRAIRPTAKAFLYRP
ncbi:MAG TPA: kelch repeat-containing protein [Gaiellaceae bacterium]|nr:kelch repeat-containing protein [Gaiellaceae bacterium]